MLTTIEKVMALQNVDIFSEVSTEQLSHLALIAQEVTCVADDVLYRELDPPQAMYLVLEGRVRLHRDDLEVTTAQANEVFGSWALFDDEPMVVTATVLEPCRLLRIDRDDFIDLLADFVQITQGVLKAMVKRLRGLVGRVQTDGSA
ncbi:MAG: CRP-like cAMP-binding protein [Candidatus Latescibacterota bacterium]|jgi:CRP-like cAMP-binding protein